MSNNPNMVPVATKRGRGRPKIDRAEENVLVLTRIPVEVQTYLKRLATFKFGTLVKMNEQLFREYLEEKPYEKGLLWKKPKVADGKNGWIQQNVLIPASIAEKLRFEADMHGESLATILYTGFYWWITYRFPPRRAEGE